MSGLYSSNALSDRTGATYRQIHYWTERGYIKPVAIEGGSFSGTGTRRIYDDEALIRCQMLVTFLTPASAAELVDRLVTSASADVAGLRLTLERPS